MCEVCIPSCPDDTPCLPDGCGGFCACPVNCANIPEGPFDPVLIEGAIASEGLAFDDAGHLVGGNIGSLFKAQYKKPAEVWVANLKQRAALAFLPTGDLMVNDNFTGTVWRVSPEGIKVPVVTGLTYPNGMTIDMEGLTYVTDETNSLVIQIQPYGDNDYEVLSAGTILHPNGITFDPGYTRLYVAGWQGDGFIWIMDRAPDGVFGPPEKWSVQLGNGLDGLETDICGNVYVNDYSKGGMIRLPPDGQSFNYVVDESFWIPNMQWGAGLGGWSPTRMYVPNGSTHEIFEIDVGIPQKAMPFP